MKTARMALGTFTFIFYCYLPCLLIVSSLAEVEARQYSIFSDNHSRLRQPTITNGDKTEEMTTLKKRYPIGMRWNGPTMDDLYLLLTKNAEDSLLESRVPRARLPTKENSEYHPELWPVMPTFFSGFHDHPRENVVG